MAARIPLAATYYSSQIKRILDPLHDNLVRLNYLKDIEYSSVNGSALITYHFSNFNTDQALAIQELMSRGVASKTAEELAGVRPAEFILDVVRLFNIRKKEGKVSTAGWIVETVKAAEPNYIKQCLERYMESIKKTRPGPRPRLSALRDFYDQDIAEKIATAKKNLTPSEILSYEARAVKIVPAITRELGESTYKLSLESVSDELLKEDLKIPAFEEWCNQRQQDASHD